MRNQKLFDYFANQHGLTLTDSELHEITLEVCQSIGIDSNEPAEWVENTKNSHREYLLVRDDNRRLQSENESLKAELKELKKGLDIALSSIEGSLNGIEDSKGNSDVIGISEVTTILNTLFNSINKLKKK